MDQQLYNYKIESINTILRCFSDLMKDRLVGRIFNNNPVVFSYESHA